MCLKVGEEVGGMGCVHGTPAVHHTVHKERTMSNKTIFCRNIAPIVNRSSRHSIHLAKFVVFFVGLSRSASVRALGISCIEDLLGRAHSNSHPSFKCAHHSLVLFAVFLSARDVEAGYQPIVSNTRPRLMRAIKMSVTLYTLG